MRSLTQLLFLSLGLVLLVIAHRPRRVPKAQYDPSQALSAIKGGFPEDINEMPPDTDTHSALPVVDGSDLSSATK